MARHPNERPRAHYDGERIVNDAAARGWMLTDLARESELSSKTVSLFVRAVVQTPKTAKKLSRALGRSPAYYQLRDLAAAS